MTRLAILAALAASLALTLPLHADETIDVKATTIHLDNDGNCISVAKAGGSVQLMLRQAAKDHTDKTGVVVLFEDSSVMLTSRQAVRLTELLGETIKRLREPDRKSEAATERQREVFRLVSNPCANGECRRPVSRAAVGVAGEIRDSLEVLNAQRARRGLPPYQRHEGLTRAAMGAARFRAERLMSGHTSNDFSALPPGVRAPVAGCAAWPNDGSFGASACYERWRYAGAATCIGRDGRAYHHLFVSNKPN